MTKFEVFAKEKQYLLGVSPATLEWYEQSLRWLNTESPTEQELKDAVLRMRTAGLKPPSCNSRIHVLASDLPASALTVLTQFVQLKVYILPLVQGGNTAIKGNTYVG